VAMTHPLIGHYGPNLLNEEKVGKKTNPRSTLKRVFNSCSSKHGKKRKKSVDERLPFWVEAAFTIKLHP
jgi:hypothetical protein